MEEQGERVTDWRQKSDEAFALVELLRDPETKELMLAIARGYEALAQHYERHKLWPRNINRKRAASGIGTHGSETLPADTARQITLRA